MKLDNPYISKVYGGFLGKIIGVIHGANVESWTYEKIKQTFGTLNGYPYNFKNFCTDDDINGPIFYMRSISDYNFHPDLPIDCMARTMLNYVADGHGFFWWGGYGLSPDCTGYTNLIQGIPAPQSGCKALNGEIVTQQVSGQIYADCWGLLCPGDPARAAKLSGRMSSVTTDGNGIYGGRFIAACIAAAFTEEDIPAIIDAGLKQIPAESEYSQVVRDMVRVCSINQDNWEKSFHYIKDHYGYQHYEGVAHIIPNSAIIVLALMHGGGDFSRTINICTMCGWDTDCNTGNAGAIMGTFCGIEDIETKWLAQVNDFVCTSSVIGSLNIQTVSQVAQKAMQTTAHLYNIRPEGIWSELIEEPEGAHFHFEFPFSTHAMRVRTTEGSCVLLTNTNEEAHTGRRCLKISVPQLNRGEEVCLYHRTYYVPQDFNDSRYDPDFSPTVYPGDQIRIWMKPSTSTGRVRVRPYYCNRLSQGDVDLPKSDITIPVEQWSCISVRIPEGKNILVSEIGFRLFLPSPDNSIEKLDFTLYADDLFIERFPSYMIEFGKLSMERWNVVHQEPAHITHLRGRAELGKEGLLVSGALLPNEVYTGHFAWDNYELETAIIPLYGDIHRVLFRVGGSQRGYAAGFGKNGKFELSKKVDGIYQILRSIPFDWKYGTAYTLIVKAIGSRISVGVCGEWLIEYEDKDTAYLSGCVGFGNENASRTGFPYYRIQGIQL